MITNDVVVKGIEQIQKTLIGEVENGSIERAWNNIRENGGSLSIDLKLNIGEGKGAPLRISHTVTYSLEKRKIKGSLEFDPDQPELFGEK